MHYGWYGTFQPINKMTSKNCVYNEPLKKTPELGHTHFNSYGLLLSTIKNVHFSSFSVV